MKVLLLGGTGAMGMYLCDILVDKGHEVFVTSRKTRSKDKVTYYLGDAHDMQFMTSILKQRYDAIIDFMIYSNEDFRNRISCLLSATDQYFFLSSSRVYDPNTVLINEDSPLMIDTYKDAQYQLSNSYSLYKAQQERILSEYGDNWTIIRPYITYSSSRLPLGILEKEDWLYRALRGRTVVFSEVIENKITTLTWGNDVSMGIASLIGTKEAIGQAYHITCSQEVKWSEVLEVYINTIEKFKGYKVKVLYSKDNYLMRGGLIDQAKNDRYYDRRFDNSKIAKFLDVASFSSPHDGLEKCLLEFLKKPSFKNIAWTMEGRRDRIAHNIANFREIPTIRNKAYYYLCRFFNK